MAAASIQRIALIGFGEVGGIFGADFAKHGLRIRIFDILLASKRDRPRMLSKARTCGVEAADDLRHCLDGADLIISAVTASSALDVAKNARRVLAPGQIFLDINSVSPETKRKVGRNIEPSQAHFVEAAVMAAVPKPRLKVPMLIGGAYAYEAAESLRSIGMNATALSDQVGVASAVKMCRSVMVKGLEALAVESLFAARKYGAEEAVLQSLAATYPSLGWDHHLPDYLVSRVAEHGSRRAAEMREVAHALRAVDVKPLMAEAIADRQDQLIAEMNAQGVAFDEKESFSWRSLADALNRNGRSRKASAKKRSSPPRKDNY